jgi:CO/xanthine dehydrogenase Mo-binding subunit
VDGYERASGSAVFTIDLALPDMLHAAILRSPHAHAKVKRVDVSAALRMPGVRAALSVDDPEAKIPWYWHAGTQKPTSQLLDRHCRYEGDEMAVVAAEMSQQARDALRAIVVEYEPLPFVIDMEEALQPGAPAIHEGGNQVSPPQKSERGDVAKGFAEAYFVLEETYQTPCEIHTPVEVHGSVANSDGDRLTVWDTTQGPFAVQAALAQYLRLPLSSVRVICPYMGGGFGSKLDLSKHTLMAALLARRTARPVKLFLSREESFRSVGNRPAHKLTLKAGVKKDGTITALELEGIGTVGAYPGRTIAGQVRELYRCANVRTWGRTTAGG